MIVTKLRDWVNKSKKNSYTTMAVILCLLFGVVTLAYNWATVQASDFPNRMFDAYRWE